VPAGHSCSCSSSSSNNNSNSNTSSTQPRLTPPSTHAPTDCGEPTLSHGLAHSSSSNPSAGDQPGMQEVVIRTEHDGRATALPIQMPAHPPSLLAAFPPSHPSAAVKQPLKRQVFISHTGQDEGAKTFAASILKPALEATGLAVYMDFSSLEMGSKWPQELVDNAANSMVVVVVLSKTFSNQFWCMLELDLALHAHQQQQEGGDESDTRQPLVLPVFYDSVDVVVDVNTIRQRWSGDLQKQLCGEEELGPEWVKTVDVGRWVGNIMTMKAEVQHVRKTQGLSKDEDWQLARCVVRAAAMHSSHHWWPWATWWGSRRKRLRWLQSWWEG
jgi:hypothetical protein